VTNFSFVVLARGRGRLDADLLRTALSHVARQHFYLNTAIELAPSPRFVVQDARPFPLRQVAAADEVRWLREAEAELNTRFDLRIRCTNPVWTTTSRQVWDGQARASRGAAEGDEGMDPRAVRRGQTGGRGRLDQVGVSAAPTPSGQRPRGRYGTVKLGPRETQPRR
jgi:hypothetical protein